MPSLTIVIPTTGRESLERAKASAWAAADDVIVVADGDESVPARVHVDAGCPGITRNAAIPHVRTEWVGFLDDDDALVPDVYRRAFDELANDGCDVVVQTMDHPTLGLIPRPQVPGVLFHGNVGISFAVRSKWWRHNPFIAGPPRTFRGEDYELVRRAQDQDRTVVISTEVGYVVTPEVPRQWQSQTGT